MFSIIVPTVVELMFTGSTQDDMGANTSPGFVLQKMENGFRSMKHWSFKQFVATVIGSPIFLHKHVHKVLQ